MISIKRLWDRSDRTPEAGDLLESSSRLRRLLLDGIVARRQLGLDFATPDFEPRARDLLRRLEEVAAPLELVNIASEILEVFENHTHQTTENFREQGTQTQLMVAMLTETVAEISGQSDAAIAQLQHVERQIERASGLDDIRALKASMASCLEAVKEATNRQRQATQATVKRLHDQIRTVPQPGEEPSDPFAPQDRGSIPGAANADYVVAFKLQRAGHILSRFGEGTAEKMLTMIAEGLKAVQGPNDGLMRWKGSSLVMFLDSSEGPLAIRRRLSGTMAKLAQQYVEVRKNSALLAVGVDWVIFPQAQYPSLDVVFAEVDSFLIGKPVEQ